MPLLTGWPDQGLAIDVATHVGTLFAVLIYFWRDILRMAQGLWQLLRGKRSDGATLVFYLLIGTIPALIAGYLVETYVGDGFRNMELVAWTMTGFAIVLYGADRLGLTIRPDLEHMTVGQAIVIGLAQAVAVIPGVSGTGITMIAAPPARLRAAGGGAICLAAVDPASSTAAAGYKGWLVSEAGTRDRSARRPLWRSACQRSPDSSPSRSSCYWVRRSRLPAASCIYRVALGVLSALPRSTSRGGRAARRRSGAPAGVDAARAIAVEISRQNYRINVPLAWMPRSVSARRAPRSARCPFQLAHLVGGQRRPGQDRHHGIDRAGRTLRDASDRARDGEGQRHQRALAAGLAQHHPHQFREAVDLGPRQLISLARGVWRFDRLHHRRGDVADIDRLEPGLAAADQRQCRRQLRHPGEAVEEPVLRPEHDRRPQDGGVGERLPHCGFARRLGARIGRNSEFASAPMAEMSDQVPGARARRFLGDRLRALGLHRLEFLRAALVQDSHQVDHRVGADDGARDRGAVAHIGGNRRHLPDDAGGLQEQGLVRAAHRNPHQPAGARQIGAPRSAR